MYLCLYKPQKDHPEFASLLDTDGPKNMDVRFLRKVCPTIRRTMLNMVTAYAGFTSEEKISPFQDVFTMGLTGDSSDGFWIRSSVIALKATAIYVINNAGADHESVKDDLSRSQWTQPEANEHRCNTLNIIKENFAAREPASGNKDSVNSWKDFYKICQKVLSPLPTALNQSPGYEGAPFVLGDHSPNPFDPPPTRARRSREPDQPANNAEEMEVDPPQPSWAQQLRNFGSNSSTSKNSEAPVAKPKPAPVQQSRPISLEGKSVKTGWEILKKFNKDLVKEIAKRFIPLLIKNWDINKAGKRISMNEIRKIFQDGMKNAELTEAFLKLDPHWKAPHGCVDARNMV